jgi:hypothetical protein
MRPLGLMLWSFVGASGLAPRRGGPPLAMPSPSIEFDRKGRRRGCSDLAAFAESVIESDLLFNRTDDGYPRRGNRYSYER